MTDIKVLHRNAMEKTDLALAAKQEGKGELAASLFQEAYNLERQAAFLIADKEQEPTRSVLLRSAASLALDCELPLEAEKLVCLALSGQPPEEIAQELRDLLEQVHFRRHLDLRGIVLQEDEVQMSIAGEGVGFGIAPTDLFLHRIQKTENLIYRTAERKQNKPYRDSGRLDKKTHDNLALYMTVPRAASFAVTFKVGKSEQLNLPGLSMGGQIIDEMLECLEFFINGDEKALKKRIPEEAYFNNFVGLARSLAPDGKQINLVGFTTQRRGVEKKVAITARGDISLNITRTLKTIEVSEASSSQDVTITGLLKYADSRKAGKDKIQIIDEGNNSHTLVVPAGMMSDIVKPLWDTKVIATGTKKGKKTDLASIRPADE